MTALNLFTTKFDQVLELVEKRAETVEYVRPCIFSSAVANNLLTMQTQLCHIGYTRSNRDIYLVCIRCYHHRCCGLVFTHCCGLYHRYSSYNRSRHLHVKYAVRLQVRASVPVQSSMSLVKRFANVYGPNLEGRPASQVTPD